MGFVQSPALRAYPVAGFVVVLLLGFSLLLAGCTGIPAGVQPVRGFVLERYLGTWHEVARLDHRFERGLSDVTATYRRRGDGGVEVFNRGFNAAESTWKQGTGRAYFIESPEVASFKVSFFGPFYGGYHVFALDPDYRWALVSGPSRDYLWILAREPDLPDAVMQSLLAKARRAGFDTDALIYPESRRHRADAPAVAAQ